MSIQDAVKKITLMNSLVPKIATSNINKKNTDTSFVKLDVRKCRICGIYDNARNLCLIKDPNELLMPMVYMVINKTISPKSASEIMEQPFNNYLCHCHIRETLFFLTSELNARYINYSLTVDKDKLGNIFETCEELKKLKGFSNKPVEVLDFSKSFILFFQTYRPTTEKFLFPPFRSATCQICMKTKKSEQCWLMSDDPAERSFWFMQAGFQYDSKFDGKPLAICRSHLQEYIHVEQYKETKPRRKKNRLDPMQKYTCAYCSTVKRGFRMMQLPRSIEERIVCFDFIGAKELCENGLKKDPPIVCRDHFMNNTQSEDFDLKIAWILFLYYSGINVADGVCNYKMPRKRCVECNRIRSYKELKLVQKCNVKTEDSKECNESDSLNDSPYVFICADFLKNSKCPD